MRGDVGGRNWEGAEPRLPIMEIPRDFQIILIAVFWGRFKKKHNLEKVFVCEI